MFFKEYSDLSAQAVCAKLEARRSPEGGTADLTARSCCSATSSPARTAAGTASLTGAAAR